MGTQIFPYANFIVGILIFIVGFILHWIGQLISIINWDFATKMGLQDKKALPEYKVYEHAIAVADVMATVDGFALAQVRITAPVICLWISV